MNIGRDGKTHITIIENHLIELYEAGVMEERTRFLAEIRQLIQEKDSRGDHVAVAVLDWALSRILRG
jgi:hypothetical protein